MMIEPQALEYKNTEDTAGPCFTIYFPEHKDPISLPVKKVIETAFNALKSSSTEPGFYRKQCWEVIKSYLVASLQLDDDKSTLLKLLAHPSFREGPINSILGPQYRCSDKQARSVHQMAVTGMFVAAAIKELRQAVLPTMVALVRHYTMVAIAQQVIISSLDICFYFMSTLHLSGRSISHVQQAIQIVRHGPVGPHRCHGGNHGPRRKGAL